jgi:glycosyltransferase involved in cell wall biosynthesis
MKISAVIITFNEESNIRAACESVSWADDILVVDSESTDQTREVAAACGARVLINPGPALQRKNNWPPTRLHTTGYSVSTQTNESQKNSKPRSKLCETPMSPS